MNNGQACVAQTRILVSERRHDEVVDALADMMSGLQVGDPADEATDIGPLVAQRQQRRVQDYIRSGRARRRPHRPRRRRTVRPSAAGMCGRRCSPTPPTTCASRGRRSSARCLTRPDATPTRTTRSASPTTATTVWPVRCGPPTSRTASRSPPGVRTGTYGINMYTLDIGSPVRRLQAVGHRTRVRARRASHEYVELQSVVCSGKMPPLANGPVAMKGRGQAAQGVWPACRPRRSPQPEG